jgi:hypothetical protein
MEVAKRSDAGGADTAIVGCALAVQREANQVVEFVTADTLQAGVARREGLSVVQLAL